MTTLDIRFDTAFQALTDYQPLNWQRRLFFKHLCSGTIPGACDLPTGLGKTAVIAIWTIALAWQAEIGQVKLPRRLVYVVNRRTVVDQATRMVEEVRKRLLDPSDSRWSHHRETLQALGEALKRLASTDDLLLAISTLRGELADNEEWKADPARPAIIIGTVDMIGSKVLFSGYGDGRYWRAQHAGLIGQDTLIVHDEAHLTPAFSELLHHLAKVQRDAGEPRPVHVMELSATPRGADGPALTLEPDDYEDEVVRLRVNATKRLHLHLVEASPQDKRADVTARTLGKLLELALEHRDGPVKVLIYVRSPEQAQDIASSLRKHLGNEGIGRVALLTGTVRGHERDRLLRANSVYQQFLDFKACPDRAAYLVSTSAGEVGIDIDADHLVCDLTTLESMVQRLGRVNRRGGQGREARVDVVAQAGALDERESQSEFNKALQATRDLLAEWASKSGGTIDASPGGLRELLSSMTDDKRKAAFAPRPTVLPLTDILLDAWSLTSITRPMPGRPEVAAYLHGLEQGQPETFVAWRKEVSLLAGADYETVSAWFQACRIEAQERLRDTTERVKKALEALLKAHRKGDSDRDFPVVVLNERGEAEFLQDDQGKLQWPLLSHVVEGKANTKYRTVVLPVEAGGLNDQGALDGQVLAEVPDVAEMPGPEGHTHRRERWLLIRDADGERCERLVTGEVAESLPRDLWEQERVALKEPAEGDEEGRSRYLVLMSQRGQSALEHPETARIEQTLSYHSQQAAAHMERIAEALHLEAGIRDALVTAARWHDRGKARPVWQWFACNTADGEPLAKSTNYRPGHVLNGYRHEFGSLLEATADEAIQKHPERDLVLHLIAAHHGWARPHFGRNAWDNSRTTAENEEAAAEAMRRFARLQQRFGRWGLAWLEALVRCADIAASRPDIHSMNTPPQAKETEL